MCLYQVEIRQDEEETKDDEQEIIEVQYEQQTKNSNN